ncbi:MAG: hypothetical protein AAB425_08580, partial [Bdellovibrionota bacterium]
AGLKENFRGEIGFAGKISANLIDPLKTLELSGALTSDKIAFREWTANRLVADLNWRASAAGGAVQVRKVVIESPERPRMGTDQGAHGGKIVIGEFGYQFGQKTPITLTAQLDGVRFQWLAAPVLEKIFAFDFRASGSVRTEVSPPSPQEKWKVSATTDLQIEDLVLDNQKLGKPKPRVEIVRAALINVRGKVELDENGIEPKGFALSFGNSSAEVRGRVDFETGLDLYTSGKVDLTDIGKLAENEIRGVGALDTHIHGPVKRILVDFDFDIEKAFYLHMALGGLKGRITLYEDPRHLFLRNLRGTKGATQYEGGGKIDISDYESIALDIESPRGTAQDFIEIFADLTSDIWWFPRALTGVTKTSIKVRGGLSLDELEVYVDEQGSQWQYWGERFKSVEGKGGYQRGRYFVESVKARKQSGEVSGAISFDKKADRLDWRLRTEGLTLTDLDHFARLDIPIRGNIQVESKGAGKLESVESATRVNLTGASVRSAPYPNSELSIASSGGQMRVHGNALDGQAIFDASYDFKEGNQSFLSGEARD